MLRLPLICAIVAIAAMPATAAVFPVKTTITEVNDPALSVTVGDLFGGSVPFDPADLPNDGSFRLDIAGRDLLLDFGSFTLTAAQDENGPTFPALTLDGGDIVGLEMNVSAIAGAFGSSVALDFAALGFDDTVLFLNPSTGATIVAGSIEVVPLPAALPLLATGGAALFWLRRRASAVMR